MPNRLEDLEVTEVSLVDQPAVPDARYLVTKRKGSTPEDMNSKDYLKKAAMVSADLASNGGLLNPQQANRFIDMMIEDTVLSREARVERLNAPKAKLEKIGFENRITGPAVEATDPGHTDSPDTDMVELNTVEDIAIVGLSYNTLEDNLERGQLADNIAARIAERVGLDMEETWVRGDESLATSDWQDSNNGVLALTTSHVTAHTSMTDATDVAEAFDLAYTSLPGKYRRNRRALRFYVHEDAEYQFRKQLAERSTAAGDRFLLEDTPVLLRGVPVVPLPVLPVYDDAGTDRSDALLVNPQNVVIGVQRAISLETDRLIRKRVQEFVATIRSDVQFEEEDAVAKVTGIETTG